MKYTIYQITNQVNNKIYIGKHQTENINDDYFGSGVALTKAIKKYGKESFVKEVLHVFDTEIEMNEKERELITEEFVSRRDTYNLGVGGEGGPHFKGRKHTKESIAQRTKHRSYIVSDTTKKLISKRNKERKWKMSESHRQAVAKSNRNRKLKQETIDKIKTANLNKRWANNGINRKKFSEEELPEGWSWGYKLTS